MQLMGKALIPTFPQRQIGFKARPPSQGREPECGGLRDHGWLPEGAVLLCRCPQAAGPRGCVHVGGEPGEHHLRGVCLPQCHYLVVPRRSAAAQLQLQQHQDLQHPIRQLPGGEAVWGRGVVQEAGSECAQAAACT